MSVSSVSIRSRGRVAGCREYSAAYVDRHLCEDSKTATASRVSGRPRVANATWWPARVSCPGVSGGCQDCYAARLERYRLDTGAAALWRMHEWDRELAAGRGAALAVAMMRRSRDRQTRLGVERPTFRVAASGDWWSAALVDAWRDAAPVVAADDAPPLAVWGYSRSYGSAGRELLARLLDDDGLPPPGWSYYLSSDASMVARTANALRGGRYWRLPVAVMADTVAAGRAMLERIRGLAGSDPRRVVACPVDSGGMPRVVSRRGQLMGACAHCRACLPAASDTAPDIVFPIH